MARYQVPVQQVFILTACLFFGPASAQFVPGGATDGPAPSQGHSRGQGCVGTAGQEVEARFDNHKLMIRARNIQYHKKANELRVLLEFHDQTQEGRLATIWTGGGHSLQLYDAYLNPQTFSGSTGIPVCDDKVLTHCNDRVDRYAVLSPSNPTFLVLRFSADNLQSTGPAAVSIPLAYFLTKNGRNTDRGTADTITFRDLPVCEID